MSAFEMLDQHILKLTVTVDVTLSMDVSPANKIIVPLKPELDLQKYEHPRQFDYSNSCSIISLCQRDNLYCVFYRILTPNVNYYDHVK